MVNTKVHPLFEIILDNWRLHGFTAKKKPVAETRTSVAPEKKAKNIYPFPRRLEKKDSSR